MKLLLDTQAFLWWMAGSPRLSKAATRAISRPDNEVFVSVATAWEIAIKRALGKLRAPEDIGGALAAESFDLLPILLPHIAALEELPQHHRDPFDRMLIAQAGVEGMRLVSGDGIFGDYRVNVLW